MATSIDGSRTGRINTRSKSANIGTKKRKRINTSLKNCGIVEETDNEKLLREVENSNYKQGHSKKLKKERCLSNKKTSFLQKI